MGHPLIIWSELKNGKAVPIEEQFGCHIDATQW